MKKPIGLQLYPFRGALAADFEGTLRAIAEMGYAGVEFLGLHDHTPKQTADIVNKLNLRVCSNHVSLDEVDNILHTAAEACELGYEIVVCNSSEEAVSSEMAVHETAEKFQAAAQLLDNYNIRLALHNHWWEFHYRVAGRFAWEYFLELAPQVECELDVYWATYGGEVDAAEIVARYRKRMPLLHIKDGTLQKERAHRPVGSGVLNIPHIIEAADPAIVEWLIVDLLEDPEADMLTSAEESLCYLRMEGFVEER